MLVEVEVVKVKSESSKDKKKEKKEKEKSPVHQEEDIQSSSPPQSDVTARMAKLSAQGGGQKLAGIMSHNDSARRSSESEHYQPPQQQHHQLQQQPAPQQSQYSQPPAQHQQPIQQPPQQQQPIQQPPQQQQQHQQSHYAQQANQQPVYHQNPTGQYQPPQTQQQTSNQYAVALVEGQGVRSFYAGQHDMNGAGGYPQNNNPYHNQYGQPNQQQPFQQQGNAVGGMFGHGSQLQNQYNGAQPSSGGPNFGDHQFSQLQQMLAQLQAGMVQLNGKMDQVGMHVVPSNPFGMGAGMNGSLGSTGMFGRPAIGFGGSNMKSRGMEIVTAVQCLIDDCEKLSGDSQGGATAQKEMVAKLEEKVSNLQARNDKLMTEKSDLLEKQANMLQLGADSSNRSFTLQAEVDSLRRDKQMLESSLSSMRDAASRSNDVMRGAENDRIRISQLEAELSSLRTVHAQAESSRSYLEDTWQRRLNDEQAKNVRLLEEKDRSHLSSVFAFEQEIRSLRLDNDNLKLTTASVAAPILDVSHPDIQAYVKTEIQRAVDAAVAASSAEVSELKTELSSANAVITQLRSELESQAGANSYNSSLQAELDEAKSKIVDITATAESLRAQIADADQKIASLETDLEEARAASIATNGQDGQVSEASLKQIMQDVYSKACEMFITEDMDDSDTAAGKASLKVVRAVLKAVSKDRSI
jgi:hypothetical protein